MRWYFPLAIAVAVLAAAQEPTFRTGAPLVQVDVVVRDKNTSVAGLTKSDFTLFDNGKPVPIALFTVTSAATPVRIRPEPLPPGTVSNRFNRNGEEPAAATVILLDRVNTPVADQGFANQKIIKFLQTRGTKDRIGIYILGNGLHIVQDLSSDPDRLNRAVKNLKPASVARLTTEAPFDPSGDAVTDGMVANALTALEDITLDVRAESVRDALSALARHLASVPGRKNLVWISASFPLFVQRPTYNIDFAPEMRKAAQALNDANVAIYPVDARGLIGSANGIAEQPERSGCPPAIPCSPPPGALPGGPSGLDTMNFLAAFTGGKAFYNTNGIEDSIRRATEDAGITYTLGFYPAPESLDGAFHKLTVKLARKAGEVRYRANYYAARSDEPPARPTMNQLLQNPLDSTGIGLLADAAPDPAKPGAWLIHATVDLHDLKLDHAVGKWTGAVNVAFLVAGAKTVRNTTWKIDIPEADFAQALEKGTLVTESIPLDGLSAVRDIRIVAQDPATGIAGSIAVPVGKP